MAKFLSNICDTVATGHVFIISGITVDSAQHFTVALVNGKSESSDTSLRLSVDLTNGSVSRNSYINGGWQSEEEDDNLISTGSNAIRRGDAFKFYILVGDDRFSIAINDKPYCIYQFRAAVSAIQVVSVTGDVEKITQIDHFKVFPSIYPMVQCEQDITYRGFIPRKFMPGHVIVISGTPYGSQDGEFIFMLNEFDSIRQILHLNIRFDQQSVVANTMDDEESWGDAETQSAEFPFAINQPFKIGIAICQNEFKIAVNGQKLLSLSYDSIVLEQGQSLWDILTGFKIKTAMDLNVQVTQVEHIQMGDSNCNGFENYSGFQTQQW